MLIDWTDKLPAGTRVIFSHLQNPEVREDLDDTVFHARMKDGSGIDVEWDDQKNEYFLTVYQNNFDNLIYEKTVKTIDELIPLIISFAFAGEV